VIVVNEQEMSTMARIAAVRMNQNFLGLLIDYLFNLNQDGWLSFF